MRLVPTMAVVATAVPMNSRRVTLCGIRQMLADSLVRSLD
jgi:hypothetical protein